MAIDGASVEGIQPISQNSEKVHRGTFGERFQRMQRIVGERAVVGRNLLELKVEEWKFQAEHNLWNVPGYFHTRPDERYFYTIFKHELLQLREEQFTDLAVKNRMSNYQRKLQARAENMIGVRNEDKLRLGSDARRIAELYNKSLVEGGTAAIVFRDTMKVLRQTGHLPITIAH